MQADLAKIFPLIDLTSLNATDDAATIAALCQRAVQDQLKVAAVCVYPPFVAQAAALLANQAVKIATVVNFPEGDASEADVIAAIRQAIQAGADEIDVVFPYSQYLAGHAEEAYALIRACKAACGEQHLLKVILETGALQDANKIAEVAYQVCHSGADFLKTSTGKIAVGATPEAVRTLLSVIQKIPRPIGLKISGGVRTLAQAKQYLEMVQEMMGAAWITPQHLRLGSSQLI